MHKNQLAAMAAVNIANALAAPSYAQARVPWKRALELLWENDITLLQLGDQLNRLAVKRMPAEERELRFGPAPAQPEQLRMPFGKYKGVRLCDLAKKDVNYLQWLAAECAVAMSKTFRAGLNQVLSAELPQLAEPGKDGGA